VADGPDPLGKRALFWMPVEAQAAGGEDDAPSVGRAEAQAHPRSSAATRHARPAGKHALYSAATPAGEKERSTSTATAAEPLPQRGILTVACSTCGSVSRVGLFEFAVLQFPVGVWLPGRTFDRRMTCPACRRRAWTSVTLSR
jgi:hypothetical protein